MIGRASRSFPAVGSANTSNNKWMFDSRFRRILIQGADQLCNGKSGCTRTIARGRIRCCAIGRGVLRCRICEGHLKFMRHFDVSRAGLSGQGAGA